jgi:hypothetical protein
MVATTQVRIPIGANYEVDLKNPLVGETKVRAFSLLNENREGGYPHRLKPIRLAGG